VTPTDTQLEALKARHPEPRPAAQGIVASLRPTPPEPAKPRFCACMSAEVCCGGTDRRTSHCKRHHLDTLEATC
jgi:hypothetical protein